MLKTLFFYLFKKQVRKKGMGAGEEKRKGGQKSGLKDIKV